MNCPICLEEIIENGYETLCGHKYHLFCLLDWIREHQNCPLCRNEIMYLYIKINYFC